MWWRRLMGADKPVCAICDRAAPNLKRYSMIVPKGSPYGAEHAPPVCETCSFLWYDMGTGNKAALKAESLRYHAGSMPFDQNLITEVRK